MNELINSKLIKVLEQSYSLHEADQIFNLIMDDKVSIEKTMEYVYKVKKYSKYDDLEDYFYDDLYLSLDGNFTLTKNHEATDKRFMLRKYSKDRTKFYDYDIPIELSLYYQIELLNKLLEVL